MTHCWPCGSQGQGACVSPKPSSIWIPWCMCMCFTQTPIYTHSLLLSSSLLLEFMLPCLACGIQGYVVLICFNYMLALSSFTFTSYISITTCVCCIIEIQDELGLANAHNLLWAHSKVSVKVQTTNTKQMVRTFKFVAWLLAAHRCTIFLWDNCYEIVYDVYQC